MAPIRKCVIDKQGNKSLVALPRFRPKQGAWTGGDSNTLYAFTDKLTGRVVVRPGGGSATRSLMRGIGPEAEVRVATRAEAEEKWQNPLHGGWKVACEEE